jgi:hypothetical protein
MSAKTANLGLTNAYGVAVATHSPANGDYDKVHAQTHDANMAILDTMLGTVQHLTANGAIALKPGLVILDKATALLATLALPVSGLPSATPPGNDGLVMTIVGKTAHAHTVTTPADGINGADDTATYANAGDSVTLAAYGGVWYSVGTPTAALSEV